MKKTRYQLKYKPKDTSKCLRGMKNEYSELINDEDVAIKKTTELKFNCRYKDVHLYKVIICREEMNIPEKKEHEKEEQL